MSLSIGLTLCQARLAEAGQKASAEGRKLKGVARPPVYNELMLQLCTVAAEVNQLKILLGSMRMIGELEPRPPEVTAESLELYAGNTTLESRATPEKTVPMFPTHAVRDERERFAHELATIGDDTLSQEVRP